MPKTLHFGFVFLSLLLALAMVSSSVGQPLPSWYKDNNRIHQYLLDLQTRFPNNIHVDSVGYGQQWHYPIWMARISNNATIKQDKPRVLLIGQVHAEEVMGVELCLRLAAEICSTYTNIGSQRYVDWRRELEIYIIPSANPEGLRVVTANWDNTYRKNCRNIWRTFPGIDTVIWGAGVGNDSDGIDLNRNFQVNWERGDTLLEPLWTGTQIEPWDYYRGDSPLSERESQVMMNINRTLQPMYCFIYHSSRQGGLSQKIFYAWDWEATGTQTVVPGRHCPDYGVASLTGTEVSAQMHTTTGTDIYAASGYRTRNGSVQDGFYQATGCIAMEVEIGAATRNAHQPDSLTWRQWTDLMIGGNYVLFNRSLNTNPTGSSITGLVTDSVTGHRLPGAEVRVRELYNRILDPRVTNDTGRYNHPLVAGIYSLEIRKYGYVTKIIPNMNVGTAQRRPQNVALAPLPWYHVNFHVVDNNSVPRQTILVIKHPDKANDTLVTSASGDITALLPADTFTVIVNHPNYVAQVMTLMPTSEAQYCEIRLMPIGGRMQEGFESGLGNWSSSDGEWGTDNQANSGTHGFGNAPGGNWMYPDSAHSYGRNTNTYATWNQIINLNQATTTVTDASLTYWIRGSLEPEHDSSWVEISTDGGSSWNYLPGTSKWQLRFDWSQVNASLRPYLGSSNVKLRWHLVADSLIYQPGIHIDDIDVRLGNQNDTSEPVALPYEYSLGTPYPNPFNATLRIPYSMKLPGIVTFRIFDVTGRTLARLQTNASTAGKHNYIWDASKTLHGEPASGLYFIEMKAGQFQAMQKVMLLK